MTTKKIPDNLKIGRRVLDKYNNIKILHDFKWDSKINIGISK